MSSVSPRSRQFNGLLVTTRVRPVVHALGDRLTDLNRNIAADIERKSSSRENEIPSLEGLLPGSWISMDPLSPQCMFSQSFSVITNGPPSRPKGGWISGTQLRILFIELTVDKHAFLSLRNWQHL